MKQSLLALLSLLTLSCAASAQSVPAMCGTSELMQAHYNDYPHEQALSEDFTKHFIESMRQPAAKAAAVDTYRIPVVFHVYGTIQGGKTVSDTLIEHAIRDLNTDFHGLNADYGQVNTQFLSLRSTLNVQFILAKKDPLGAATTGIEYFPVKSGYAGYGTMDAQIAADAWDNYRYVNVYVMNDLFANGMTGNSGVATYPSTSDNDNKISRIVYNGAFLSTNNRAGNMEFASVLTHEFGHYFNLIHTFEGGCTAPNDNVADTPPCTQAQGCHATPGATIPINCNGNLVNSDNYMDYNICYKMFTQGQTDRMTAAMSLPSRITLWQDSNLRFTGIYPAITTATGNVALQPATIRPNPSSGRCYIDVSAPGVYDVTVHDALGRIVYRQSALHISNRAEIDISGNPQGIYFLHLNNGREARRLRLELL